MIEQSPQISQGQFSPKKRLLAFRVSAILTNTICPACRFTKYGAEKHSWKPVLHAPTVFVTIPSTSDTPTSPFRSPMSLLELQAHGN